MDRKDKYYWMHNDSEVFTLIIGGRRTAITVNAINRYQALNKVEKYYGKGEVKVAFATRQEIIYTTLRID